MAAFYDHNPLLSISFASQFIILTNNQSSNQSVNDVSPGTLSTGGQAVITAIIILMCLAVIGVCLWIGLRKPRTGTDESNHSDEQYEQSDDQSHEQYEQSDDHSVNQLNNSSNYQSNGNAVIRSNASNYQSNGNRSNANRESRQTPQYTSRSTDESVVIGVDASSLLDEHHHTKKARQPKMVV
jgi:hypothetical protein